MGILGDIGLCVGLLGAVSYFTKPDGKSFKKYLRSRFRAEQPTDTFVERLVTRGFCHAVFNSTNCVTIDFGFFRYGQLKYENTDYDFIGWMGTWWEAGRSY